MEALLALRRLNHELVHRPLLVLGLALGHLLWRHHAARAHFIGGGVDAARAAPLAAAAPFAAPLGALLALLLLSAAPAAALLLAVCALALVVSALVSFAAYMVRSLDMQRTLRADVGRCALVSVGGDGIYAKEITGRVKIFTMWDQEKYYLGRPGDWLAVRADDPSDVYVIEKGIFEKTYEKWT